MIRKHESAFSWPAAMLSIAMHGLLVVWMIVSVDWKAAHNTPQVMQAELWEALPDNAPSTPEPLPEMPIEEPLPPQVEPPPPPPEPVAQEVSQDEIALKREAEKKEKLKQEKIKEDALKEEALKKEQAEKKKIEEAKAAKQKALIAQMREEELNAKRTAALKALQGEIEGEKTGSSAPANNAELNAYTEKLKAKIRGNVNQALCPEGNPELRFDLRLLPTGEIASTPKLSKSSGDSTCDDAVARAILASEPFAMPSDAATRDKMLNLKLKFKPKD